jgi:hypothetical protein
MDSPRCFDCLRKGLIGQMYKIAGKSSFKCHDCGWVGRKEMFESPEFEWKTNKDAWEAYLKAKGIDIA